MTELIEIWIVIAIAAVLVIASLVLTSFAGARRHARRDAAAFRWLAGTNIAFLLGAMGLMLAQVLPFWISATMVILGMLLGLIVGSIALLIGIGENPAPQRYLMIALALGALQGGLAAIIQDVSALVISSSLVNGIIGLALARQLWRRAQAFGKELALLASAPFLAIGIAYLVRLGLVFLGVDAFGITVMTLIITFLMAFSALQWGFALLAFRAARLNRFLEQARDQAEESSRLKSRFLANMSHELRTPLNGILGMTQALEDMIAAPEQARMLATIRDSGEGLLATLNDILDLSKIQSGQVEIRPHPFDLQALVEKTALLFSVAAQAKSVGFSVDIALDHASARLGDEHRVRQILGNLLSNAVKFTEQGTVRCLVRASGDEVRFRIEDTGIGMTEPQLARVFDEFVQADVSITRRFGGTGLGMPIVSELTQQLGGQIGVTSEFGVGTQVDLCLPLPIVPDAQNVQAHDLPSATVPLQRAASADDATRSSGPPPDRGGPLRVLIAEDNKVNQKVMAALLRGFQVELTIVDHGGLAVDMARGDCFDLFLFDAMMPELDGLSALRQITALYTARAQTMPPAVIVTANVAPEQIAEYRAAGFLDVIEKPISKARLLACLSALDVCPLPIAAPAPKTTAAPVQAASMRTSETASQR